MDLFGSTADKQSINTDLFLDLLLKCCRESRSPLGFLSAVFQDYYEI